MKKVAILSLSVLSLSLLACGGGGGDGGGIPFAPVSAPGANQGAPTPEPGAADSGSVSAKFVPNEQARFMLLASGSQTFGNKLTDLEQAESGAMVRLGDNTLSGERQIVDIAGDANFALGRWLKGTVTRSSGADTLTGGAANSRHYIAYNGLAALPGTGTANCSTGAFTAPTAFSGGAAGSGDTGSASGSASVVFDADGATVQGSIQVTVGGETASVNLPVSIKSPGATSVGGSMLANGPGAALTLGDQGNGAYALVVGYVAQLQSGVRYAGVARLACTGA